jgi:hypothetical protein
MQNVTANAGTIAENKYYIYNIRSYAYMLFKHKHHFSSFLLLVSVFVIHSLLFIVSSSAQSITWQKLYHPTPNWAEVGYGVCPADGPNNYLVGTNSFFDQRAYVLKINAYGDTLWSRFMDSVSEAFCCCKTDDDGLLIGGYYSSGVVCKMDKNGNVLWRRFLPNSLSIMSVKNISGIGFAVCGHRFTGLTYCAYAGLIDVAGDIVWAQNYFGERELYFTAVEKGNDSGYVVAGYQVDGNGHYVSYFAKLGENGNMLWNKTYSFTPDMHIVYAIFSNTNSYITAGHAGTSAFLAKLTNSGDTALVRLLPDSLSFTYITLTRLNANKFLLTRDYEQWDRLITVDSNFNTIRELMFRIPNDYTVDIFASSLAGGSNAQDVLCVGQSDIFNLGGLDMYALRIDSALAFVPPIGVEHISESIPENIELKQNYPNPFNPTTSIEFDLPYDGSVKITVYDVLGKEIYTLNEYIKAGTHEIKFDGASLASGIYFYKLETGSFVATKKMVLLK